MAKAIKVTVELDIVEVSSGDYTAQFDWRKLPKDKLEAFVTRAAQIGVAKAGNDSASGAKAYANKEGVDIEEARSILIDKWINARYESGEFGAVRGGDGMNAVDREAVSLVRPKVKTLLGDKYEKADADVRNAMCVEYIAGLDESKRQGLYEYAEAEIARKDALKAQRAAMLDDLDIDLDD